MLRRRYHFSVTMEDVLRVQVCRTAYSYPCSKADYVDTL